MLILCNSVMSNQTILLLLLRFFLLLFVLSSTVQGNRCTCESMSFNDERNIQKRLYREFYLSLYDSMKPSQEPKNTADLILRRTGLILKYSQFEVPNIYREMTVVRIPSTVQYGSAANDTKSEPIIRAVLPPWVVQAMFDISDTIPNMTHWIANPEDGNVRFSSSYSLVVNQMLDHIRRANFRRLKDVYSYLKEPLYDTGNDTGSEFSNNRRRSNNTARLILYHRYKREYYQTKVLVETEINTNRKVMSRKEFKWWYQINYSKLLGRVKDSLQRWYDYGQKGEVEDWLAQTHAFNEVHNIEAAKRLLRAYKQPSWDQYSGASNWDSETKDETFIYRVRFLPLDWFEHLKLKFSESKDQIKYRIRENEKNIKKLRKLREAARQRTSSPEYIKKYREMKKRYILQKTKLMKNVMARKYHTQMCRFTTKKKYCREVTRLRPIIARLQSRHAAIHWEYQKFKTPLPKYGGHVMKSIDKEINASINVSITLNRLLKEHSTLVSENDEYLKNDEYFTSNITNFVHFSFDPRIVPRKVKRFNNFKLPRKLASSRLWFLNRDRTNNRRVNKTITKYLPTVEGYLNSIVDQIRVNASLMKVEIERKWFNQTLFRTLMKFSQAEFLVSPGPQPNPSKFRKKIASNKYLLPAFPSSLLIATNVRIILPGSSYMPSRVIKDLLALSYEPRVSGGFGPFSFGYMFGDKMFHKTRKQLKFRIDVFDEEVVMSIPGSQLIGYVCHVVNKFPS